MRALLSLGLDLLGHPWWLCGCVIGIVAGIWLCLEANRDAKRDYLERHASIDAAWWRLQQEAKADAKAKQIHRSARSIVHPDEAV